MFIARSANPKNHVKAISVLVFIAIVTSLYLIGMRIITQPPVHQSLAAESIERTMHRYSAMHEKSTPATSDAATKTTSTAATAANTITSAKASAKTNSVIAMTPSRQAAAVSSTKKVQPHKPSYHIGQTRSFSLYDDNGHKERTFKARLLANGTHTFIWVDNARYVPKATLSNLITRFDKHIYPRDVEYFANATGRERATYVNILITDLNGLDGYFDANDISGQNNMKLIYLDGGLIKTTPDEAYSTLAHEFEHLLFYLSDGADVEWLDEGMAVYAEYLNGGFPATYVDDYEGNPNVKLATGFTTDNNNSYGAAFLFIAFAADQVKQSHNSVPKFTQALIENSSKSLKGVNIVLHRYIKNKYKDSYQEVYQPQQLIKYGIKLQNAAP